MTRPELDRIRAEYESLVDSLSDTVFKLDLSTGKLVFLSAAATDLFGSSPDRLVGTVFTDHIAPEDLGLFAGLYEQVQASQVRKVQRLTFRIRTRAGDLKHVDARFSRLTSDETGVVTGVLRDMQNEVEIAEQLNIESVRLHHLFESSGAAAALTDRSGRILMTNSTFCDFKGVLPPEIEGKPLAEIIERPFDPALHESWLGAPANGAKLAPAKYDKVMDDARGRERILSITATPIANSAGVLRQIVFMAVDDTERREAEQALSHTERLAMVGEMSAAVAHEMAQPLQVINLSCHSLLDELANAEAGRPLDRTFIKSKVGRMIQQVDRGQRIVQELRAFVRSAPAEDHHPFDVATAIHGAADLVAPALRHANVRVDLELQEALPLVMGQINKLEQVIINLINNAKDAGGTVIKISAKTVDRETGLRGIKVAIQDNGPGIAPEILRRMFDSFVTSKPRGVGTGLGLRICRRIIEEMGGTITGGNASDGGAIFEVSLPEASP